VAASWDLSEIPVVVIPESRFSARADRLTRKRVMTVIDPVARIAAVAI